MYTHTYKQSPHLQPLTDNTTSCSYSNHLHPVLFFPAFCHFLLNLHLKTSGSYCRDSQSVSLCLKHYIYIKKIYIRLQYLQILFIFLFIALHVNATAENIKSHFYADVHLAVSKVSTSSNTSNGDYCDYSLSQTVSMVTMVITQ